MVNGTETEFPLPEPDMPLNYINSVGLRYEAEEVRRCLLKGRKGSNEGRCVDFRNFSSLTMRHCATAVLLGLKESPEMPWAHSKLVAETVDEAWRQIGVAYD